MALRIAIHLSHYHIIICKRIQRILSVVVYMFHSHSSYHTFIIMLWNIFKQILIDFILHEFHNLHNITFLTENPYKSFFTQNGVKWKKKTEILRICIIHWNRLEKLVWEFRNYFCWFDSFCGNCCHFSSNQMNGLLCAIFHIPIIYYLQYFFFVFSSKHNSILDAFDAVILFIRLFYL